MTHDQPRDRRGRPRWLRSPIDLAPLRAYGQFRLLWSSRTVTLLGTQVSEVALLVQVRQLTGSTVLTGLRRSRHHSIRSPAAHPVAADATMTDGAATHGGGDGAGILAGFRYARGRQDLLGSYLADLAAMLLAYPASLFPFLAAGLHASWATGLMFSAQAAGAMVASVTSRWISRVRRYGRAIALAAAAWGLTTAGLGIAPDLAVALALLAAGGGADMLSAMFRDTLWNRTIPDSMRGRMAGIEVLSYSLGPSAGQLRAGAVAELVSIRFALWSGGLACVAAVGVTCLALPGFFACDVPSTPGSPATPGNPAATGDPRAPGEPTAPREAAASPRPAEPGTDPL